MPELTTRPSRALSLTALNVTNSVELPVEIPDDLSGLDAARSIATLMLLPDGDWVLRDNRSGAYIRDEDRIGDTVTPGTSVTLTTRARLGSV